MVDGATINVFILKVVLKQKCSFLDQEFYFSALAMIHLKALYFGPSV
jgi:hypothetical protein